jgi:adenylate cyclase
VVIPDAKASRQHALVHGQEAGEFWLVDLGSANGTYLNGRRVSQPCRLSEGDQIGIAGLTFTFRGPERRFRDATSGEATIHDIRSLACFLIVADIQRSTELLRTLSPEQAPRIIGRWLAACRKTLELHHGTINKFLGDGFLAYWHAGPDAGRGVAGTLLSLKQLQDEANPAFRLVLHYGLVSIGGTSFGAEESLTGNEVHFVFRMEKLAGSLGAPRLLSEPAHAQIKTQLPATPHGRHAVPGFAGDHSFFSF